MRSRCARHRGARAACRHSPRTRPKSVEQRRRGRGELGDVAVGLRPAELAAGARPRLVVGFAAETRDVLSYAQAKLKAKGLDLIIANRVGPDAAFDRDDNALTVVSAEGAAELGSGSKRALAARLVELVAARLGNPP